MIARELPLFFSGSRGDLGDVVEIGQRPARAKV